MASLRLPVQTYQHRSTPASPTRLLNCFAETLPDDARSPYILTKTPGAGYLTVVNSTAGDGPIQGMHVAHGVIYVICGQKLYSLTGAISATGTLLGSVPSASGNYDMDSNETHLVVTTGGQQTYVYGDVTGSPTFAQISDADFLAYGDVDEVEFLDNFLLFSVADSETFFGADVGSATAFDALNFASAEGFPDKIKGLKSDHRQLLIFGEKTTEIWESVERSGFPFERVPNGFIQVGCAAGRTVSRLGSSVAWVADDFTVRVLEGVSATRISTHAIDQWLRSVTISSGRASSYQYEGHTFYVLSFDEGTRVFDLATGEWHERQSHDQENWRWGFACVHPTDGSVIVGQTSIVDPISLFDGKIIAKLSPTVYADAYAEGEYSLIRTEWVYQPVYSEGKTAFHHRLEMGFEVGVGLEEENEGIIDGATVIGGGTDPVVMLDYSDDGGVTWKSLPNKRLGSIGEYQKRVVWHALGSSKNRVYRGSVSDPVRVTLIDTQLEVTGGRL